MKQFNLEDFIREQEEINLIITEGQKNLQKSNKITIDAMAEFVRREDERVKAMKEIKENYDLMKNTLREYDEKLKQQSEVVSETKEEVVVLKDKLNTLELEDERTLKEIFKEGRRRVVSICDGKTTPRYILFSRGYFQEMYGFIGEALANGKRVGKIKVEDGATAMTLIKRWKPKSDKKRTQDLQKMDDKGLLSSVKSKALEMYLDEINS